MVMNVNLQDHSYPIYIENGIFKNIQDYITPHVIGQRIFIISDENVFGHYGEQLRNALERFRCYHFVLPPGEQSKDITNMPDIYTRLIEANIGRNDLIIAFGGGVIGDVAGFAAATYLRGIKFIQIPTSLLAQVDSSVGGKVAVDLPQGKNMVGAFYQPQAVIIDPDLLQTLPKRFLADGLAEVIKYGCIKDAQLFETIEKAGSFDGLASQITELIIRSIAIKKEVVERDPFEKGERTLLNFGHTIGHAVEQFYNYKRETHGEAVAIGMYQITRIAEHQGLTASGTAQRIQKVLKAYELPVAANILSDSLLEAIARDKKNMDTHLNLVLLKEIGESYIYPCDLSFFSNSEMV